LTDAPLLLFLASGSVSGLLQIGGASALILCCSGPDPLKSKSFLIAQTLGAQGFQGFREKNLKNFAKKR
jgi:hypothetical protein